MRIAVGFACHRINRTISRKITRNGACMMIPHVRICMRKIRKRGNNSRCHDIAGILEGRRYEARRNTYIYLRFRPLANKRRLGWRRNGVCAVGLPSKSKRGMRENRSAKSAGNWSGKGSIIIFRCNESYSERESPNPIFDNDPAKCHMYN